MGTPRQLLPAAVLLAALQGCGQSAPPPEPAPERPSGPVEPAVERPAINPRALPAAPVVTRAPNDPLGRIAAGIVDRQVAAYNAHDVEGFLATYGDSVAVQNLGDTVTIRGKAALRKSTEAWFDRAPGVRSEVVNRMVMGPFVVDYHRLTSAPDDSPLEVVGIYEVRDSLIRRVWFLPPPPRTE